MSEDPGVSRGSRRATARRVSRDDHESLFDEVRVLPVLSFSPSFERAFQDVVNICGSLLGDGERRHRLGATIPSAARADLFHDCRWRALDHLPGPDLREPDVESLAQDGELFLLKRIAYDVRHARVLADAHAFFGEGLEVFWELDRFGCVGHVGTLLLVQLCRSARV